jgi:hypothetical protein
MPLYFLLLDAGRFHEQMVPALAASWRQRSFAPCRALCAELAPAAAAFAERYGTGPGKPLLDDVVRGLPFRRDLWKHLVGEVLLYGAAALPDVPTAPDALRCLLDPAPFRPELPPRTEFTPIEQAHFGSRDLVFGSGFYRPEQAGVNDLDDVRRLAEYLGAVDPTSWSAASLAPLPELETEEDRADEVAFARECLVALGALYAEARQRRQIVICELLEAGRSA